MKYIGVIIGIVIIGTLGFFALQKSSSPEGNDAMNNEGGDSAMMQEGSFSGSLLELANRGGNYRCTFTHDSDVALSQGEVFIAGDKIRGDFKSSTQGISVESHMIVRDGFIYTWSPITPNGFKIPQAATQGDGDASASGQYSDFQQAYSYDCKAWTVDESKFTLPQISFVDINGS